MEHSPFMDKKQTSIDETLGASVHITEEPTNTKRVLVDFSKKAFQPDPHLFSGENTNIDADIETKHTYFTLGKKERVIREKQPTPRVITRSEQWTTYSAFLDPFSQKQLLNCIFWKVFRENEIPNGLSLGNEFTKELQTCADYVYRQLHDKQSGYRHQDIVKNIFNPTLFISIPRIVELLRQSELLCFYCREEVKILYEHVRDKKQWSLERLDNAQGHNTDNVVIACLSCNLRRRTMHYERYVATKQLRFLKIDRGEKGEGNI